VLYRNVMEVHAMGRIVNGSLTLIAGALLLTAAAYAGPQAPPENSQPIYHVTVVSRTLPAVNYEHLGGPTDIGFQGTVLLPYAKGDATIDSKRGRTAIDARFDHMDPPTRFGSEYLTYVLWAITPEGRPKNLGEVVLNSSNKAKIDVTTDLQALGLMVTAEPYYAVTMPSDVVVLENVIRPDTIGKREVVTAKYDLLPRGQYTMVIQPGSRTSDQEALKLPYDRYESLLEVYQAQNAVQIAQSLGADRYAPDTFQKAQQLLQNAQQMQASKQDTHMIVSEAREAAQTAEDARAIAVRRATEARVSQVQQENSADRQAREQAVAEAQEAKAQADAERAQAEDDRASAQQAQAEAAQAQALAAQREREATAAASEAIQAKQAQSVSAQKQSRAEMLAQLNGILPTRDTPRGLLVTVPAAMIDNSAVSDRLTRIATIVSTHPGLAIRVEGYTDDRGNDTEAQRHADTVRGLLVADGLTPNSVTAVGFGKDRPVTSNATAAGREQNRRVEIVISGEPIGNMALWDRAYSLEH
jgi:outer membrane protein OmpA-like peptidoglycan-associated protein